MNITFFGHADFQATAECIFALRSLLQKVTNQGQTNVYLGGYGNFDFFAYQCCKDFQKSKSDMRLIYISPYLDQKHPLQNYDEYIYPPLENIPRRLSIIHRNRWMVEHAHLVVVYVTHSYGGAYTAYSYAKHKNILSVNLADIAIRGLSEERIEDRLMEIYELLENDSAHA